MTHAYWFYASRRDAQMAAVTIEDYKSRTGRYPESLEAAGMPVQYGFRWRMGYSADDQKPFLFYAATYTVFDTYRYNFASHKWEYWPD